MTSGTVSVLLFPFIEVTPTTVYAFADWRPCSSPQFAAGAVLSFMKPDRAFPGETKWAFRDKRWSHPAIEHIVIFSVRESLKRRHAPDIQQFGTPAQFELRQLKECLRSRAQIVVVSAKSSGNRA